MANNLDSNIVRKLAEAFLPAFEDSKVLLRTVNSQLLTGKFNPASGSTTDFRRPHNYEDTETADGDISGGFENDIIAGKATGTVQNYITVPIPWSNIEEALELDKLTETIAPAATRLITTFEMNLAAFMIKEAGLSYGVPGNSAFAWSDVAGAGALMESIGIPMVGEAYYLMNPFVQTALADAQNGLTAADQLVRTAWENAQISGNFGGLRALTGRSLKTYTIGATTDRIGALAATPTATYLAVKDTMQQTLSLTGLTASVTGALKAGDILEFTGVGALARSFVNVQTRETVFGADAAPLKWRCTVNADADTDGSGDASVLVSSAAVFEADGQYNNISAALTSGDIFTILGALNTVTQPNLFYHRDAFGVGTVPLPKLFSTDTVMTTKDGYSIRVSKYSDGDANTQKVRFDILPAFATFNPLFAGKGYANA